MGGKCRSRTLKAALCIVILKLGMAGKRRPRADFMTRRLPSRIGHVYDVDYLRVHCTQGIPLEVQKDGSFREIRTGRKSRSFI